MRAEQDHRIMNLDTFHHLAFLSWSLDFVSENLRFGLHIWRGLGVPVLLHLLTLLQYRSLSLYCTLMPQVVAA